MIVSQLLLLLPASSNESRLEMPCFARVTAPPLPLFPAVFAVDDDDDDDDDEEEDEEDEGDAGATLRPNAAAASQENKRGNPNAVA